MGKLIDKFIVFICCLVLYLSVGFNPYSIVPIVLALTIGSFTDLFHESYIDIIFFLVFIGLCMLFPEMLYFLPFLSYNLFGESYQNVIYICIPVIYLNWSEFGISFLFYIAAVSCFVYLLKKRYQDLAENRQEIKQMRLEFYASKRTLNSKNHDLLERQDYEVNNATLNERNRIAREIHDIVGHLLSSSILQIAALMAITKDPATKESLTNIKDTLSTGMDSIRASIHNLHEESVDLELKINGLINDFDFCPLSFNYSVTHEIPIKAKYSVIYIVQEALTNIMKHSNATHVSITIDEMPVAYQLVIADNGTTKGYQKKSGGMGTISIQQRVDELDGTFTINNNEGYKIFITIPKINSDKEENE